MIEVDSFQFKLIYYKCASNRAKISKNPAFSAQPCGFNHVLCVAIISSVWYSVKIIFANAHNLTNSHSLISAVVYNQTPQGIQGRRRKVEEIRKENRGEMILLYVITIFFLDLKANT